MAYLTNYTLKTTDGPRIYEILEKETVDTFEGLYAVDEAGVSDEPCKWYDHENDMIALSKKHPNVTFQLEGTGEAAGDIWIKYFKNGKMQTSKAEITLPPLDNETLK